MKYYQGGKWVKIHNNKGGISSRKPNNSNEVISKIIRNNKEMMDR